ncbi:hypothetical protein [Aeromonas hydrophila]|uniref:hypothetical protein n=1 Tax=Aeromonas hydrophila TaxID=644 RepID=UPI0007601565|nr:hypothetical protein [Aeromonas hydrophila]KWR67687.1 hypothetical protein ATO50_00450 [Aeromonas hydrophila]HAU4930542.1 hypothetical protein [Aeromonas hydrophila]
MNLDNLIYLLDTIASTEAGDIDNDAFDVLWEDERGREGWTEESITAVAQQAALTLTAQAGRIRALRSLVQRMAANLTQAGEVVEADSMNPIKAWLADADKALQEFTANLPSAEFLCVAEQMIGTHPFLYVELSRTRTTDWMAWLRTKSKESEGVLLASGQGLTPDEACRYALAQLKEKNGGAA